MRYFMLQKRLLFARFLSSCPSLWRQYEVVIGGGGIMGCSSAYFLASSGTGGARLPPSAICVVEKDTKYEEASTPLSVGSIRQQFSLKENIQMSLHSHAFIKNIPQHLHVDGNDPPDVQYVDGSYLFLASERGEKILRENYEIQRSVGAEVELLSPKQLKELYPWMNVRDIALGCRGLKNEGWFDPWLFLQAFKKKIISMGVDFINAEVTGINIEDNKVQSTKIVRAPDGEEESLGCRYFVNAGGPWAASMAGMAGIGDPMHPDPTMRVGLPIAPRKRCVYVVKCPPTNKEITPLVIDTNGTYFRPEMNQNSFLAGAAPPTEEDHDGLPLEVDYNHFDNFIWPTLANRVPAFEALKLQSAWAGYYEYNTLDQNGVIGAHPVITNFIFANGFSGHGIQQSPAVGKAVSEVILDGESHSIDLSRFSFQRIIDNEPQKERNIV